MPSINMMPIVGMNTETGDDGLMIQGKERRHYVRDAENVNISETGSVRLRGSPLLLSATQYRAVWHCEPHGMTFGAVGDQWGVIDTTNWSFDALVTIGLGDICHELLNDVVIVAGSEGIFSYASGHVERLTIETPAPPLAYGNGEGLISVAVSWLRGGKESGLSPIVQTQGGTVTVNPPLTFDNSITGMRVYATTQDGGELYHEGDYPVGTVVTLSTRRNGKAQFKHLSPMPTGRFMGYWNGRLVTARGNVLRFSEAMAYHLHDERFGYVQMPQKITFMVALAGGIWVGQSDHVVFLSGASPAEMTAIKKATREPVPMSAIKVLAEVVGADISDGGSFVAVWLSGNGYVIGTSSGGTIETNAGRIRGVTARTGSTTVAKNRLTTAIQ